MPDVTDPYRSIPVRADSPLASHAANVGNRGRRDSPETGFAMVILEVGRIGLSTGRVIGNSNALSGQSDG